MPKRYLPLLLIPVALLALYFGWRTFLADETPAGPLPYPGAGSPLNTSFRDAIAYPSS